MTIWNSHAGIGLEKVGMKTLLFLSDLSNGYEEEDKVIGRYLGLFYDVVYSDIYSCEALEDKADIVLVRNTWPWSSNQIGAEEIDRYRSAKTALRKRLTTKNIYTYNANNGRGDMQGKQHILDLQAANYPVIPSITRTEDLHRLPRAERYRIKPMNGFSAWLQGSYAPDALPALMPDHFIIQPHISFRQEISVYYVDSMVFCVAACPDKGKVDMHIIDDVDNRYIAFAEQFRKWNTLSHGLQRIDFIETQHGELLLMEIEDDAPYYSLIYYNNDMKKKFFSMLHHSLEENSKQRIAA